MGTKRSKSRKKERNARWVKTVTIVSIILGIVVAFLTILQVFLNIPKISIGQNHETLPSVTISGSIRDANFQPIMEARITIDGEHFHAKSRVDGTFLGKLTQIPKGEILNFRISHPAYETMVIDRTISTEKATIDVILKKTDFTNAQD